MTDTTFPSGKVMLASPDRVNELAQLPHATVEKTEPSAQVRLEASRARVRGALIVISHPPKRPSLGTGVIDKLTDMVKDVPGVTLVLDTAKSWWDEHAQTARTAGQASIGLVGAERAPPSSQASGHRSSTGRLACAVQAVAPAAAAKGPVGAASLIATQAIRSRSASSWLQAAMQFAGSLREDRH